MKPSRSYRGVALLIGALIAAPLAACSADAPDAQPAVSQAPDSEGANSPAGDGWMGPDAALADVMSVDGKTLVDELDRLPLPERPGFMASVRSNEVLVNVDGQEGSVDLPADEFYVSIAPYAEQTHDCFYHSLTTCVGELRSEAVHVVVTTDDGEIVVDEETETFANGFLGLWLPRDISGTIEVTHAEGTVSAPIATGADDPTCVTTLQLT